MVKTIAYMQWSSTSRIEGTKNSAQFINLDMPILRERLSKDTLSRRSWRKIWTKSRHRGLRGLERAARPRAWSPLYAKVEAARRVMARKIFWRIEDWQIWWRRQDTKMIWARPRRADLKSTGDEPGHEGIEPWIDSNDEPDHEGSESQSYPGVKPGHEGS